jgi:hypothetical protein
MEKREHQSQTTPVRFDECRQKPGRKSPQKLLMKWLIQSGQTLLEIDRYPEKSTFRKSNLSEIGFDELKFPTS